MLYLASPPENRGNLTRATSLFVKIRFVLIGQDPLYGPRPIGQVRSRRSIGRNQTHLTSSRCTEFAFVYALVKVGNSMGKKLFPSVTFRTLTKKEKVGMKGLTSCSKLIRSQILGRRSLSLSLLALFTRYHEKHIVKSRHDDLCRICKKQPETVFHILSGCDVLSKREYFTRHNNLCQYVHYEVMKHYGFACGSNWYVHKPKDVVLSKNVEIAYDQTMTTDGPVGANRPDILIRDMASKKTVNVRMKRLRCMALSERSLRRCGVAIV